MKSRGLFQVEIKTNMYMLNYYTTGVDMQNRIGSLDHYFRIIYIFD